MRYNIYHRASGILVYELPESVLDLWVALMGDELCQYVIGELV